MVFRVKKIDQNFTQNLSESEIHHRLRSHLSNPTVISSEKAKTIETMDKYKKVAIGYSTKCML